MQAIAHALCPQAQLPRHPITPPVGNNSLTQSFNSFNTSPTSGVNRKRFTSEEDEKLRQLVAVVGPKKWSKIASLLPGRTAKQCRDRYQNYLVPGFFRGEWTREEDLLLIEKFREFGPQWAKISKFFEGRSANIIKNRWNYFVCRNVENIQQFSSDSNSPSNSPSPSDSPSNSPPLMSTIEYSKSEVNKVEVSVDGHSPLNSSLFDDDEFQGMSVENISDVHQDNNYLNSSNNSSMNNSSTAPIGIQQNVNTNLNKDRIIEFTSIEIENKDTNRDTMIQPINNYNSAEYFWGSDPDLKIDINIEEKEDIVEGMFDEWNLILFFQ